MNRAKPSVAWPNASGSGLNLGRIRWRALRGVSRLPFDSAVARFRWFGFFGALLSANTATELSYRGFAVVGAPVVRQQVIQYVINSHRPHKPAGVIDHGEGVQVIGSQGPGHFADVGLVRQRFEILVHQVSQCLERREAQQLLDMHHAQEPACRRFEWRPGNEDGRRQGRGKLLPADVGEGFGNRGFRGKDDRYRRHQAAGSVLVVLKEAADVLGALGLHELEQFLGLGGGEFTEKVAGVVGIHLLKDVSGALDIQGGEDLHLVVLREFLEDVCQPFVLQLAGHLEPALVAHLLQGFGEVGGFEVLVVGHELGGCLWLGARSLLGVRPVDDQRFVAAQPAHGREGVSAPRCSKRRRFTRPVQITWVWSIEVMRVMGTKTRFFPGTSTTMPTTCGAPWVPRDSTTTSRSRPSRSPSGSKTSRPRRRATKTRVGVVLTTTGYRVCSLLAEFTGGTHLDGQEWVYVEHFWCSQCRRRERTGRCPGCSHR